MREHSRRRFIREILSASICTSAFSGVANRATGRSNEGLTELCVIARQPGTLANAIIDVWTGQVGILDVPQLPQDFGRSVVWDDVRDRGALPREITRILFAIEEHFGIECEIGSNAFAHIGHYTEFSLSSDALLQTLSPRRNDALGRRIAIIDLSSCGLTRLGWLHVLPSLRSYYTCIIGVDFSAPELCELDVAFRPPHGLCARALETMHACDYWLLASDKSISGQDQLSADERSFEFTRAICALCECLAFAQHDIDTAIPSVAKQRFASFGAPA
jgi:hypothetical protein